MICGVEEAIRLSGINLPSREELELHNIPKYRARGPAARGHRLDGEAAAIKGQAGTTWGIVLTSSSPTQARMRSYDVTAGVKMW